MDVLTSETCWALNNEIIKQATSSWSLFVQALQNFTNCYLKLIQVMEMEKRTILFLTFKHNTMHDMKLLLHNAVSFQTFLELQRYKINVALLSAMKVQRESWSTALLFLWTSVLDGDRWLTPRHGRLNPGYDSVPIVFRATCRFEFSVYFYNMYRLYIYIYKGKVIPLQAQCDPQGG